LNILFIDIPDYLIENTVFKGCDVAPDSFTFICGWLNKKPLNPPNRYIITVR